MAWTTVTTEEFKNGNNSNKDFTFAFPYLQQEDVKVQLLTNNIWVDNTAWTFHNDTTIRFTSAPPTGTANVRIYRDTEVDAAKAIYAAGSSVRAKDLNDNQDQVLYALQEEQFNGITTNDIRDGTIMDVDINAAAELQVSKLKDGAARQVLQTAADGTTVEWTDNIDVPGTLDVTGAADFDSTVKVDGTLNVVSAVDFDNNLNVDGTLTVDGTSTLTGNVSVGGTVDGRDVAADGTKLDGIEPNATADQTTEEIQDIVGPFIASGGTKTGITITYEDSTNDIDFVVATQSDNNFTNTLKTKLDGIESNAKDDQTVSEIKNLIASSPLDASHLAADSVGASELADNSVASANIINGSITNDDIAANADIGGAKILEGSISNDKLMPGQITGSELAPNVVNKVEFIGAGGTAANNKVLVYDTGEASGWKWATQSGSGGGSAIEVLNDSTSLTTGATKFTFTGAGVTASEPSTDEITVTIPGTDTNTTYTTSFVDSSDDCILRLTDSGSGTDDLKFVAGSNITLTPSGDNLTIASTASGGALTVSNEGSDTGDDATTINFVGAGVTATGSGATKTVTIGGSTTATDFKLLELKTVDNVNAGPTFDGNVHDYELVNAGTTTAVSPAQAEALFVSIGGVIQQPQPNQGDIGANGNGSDGFALDGSSIHFGAGPAAAPDFIIYQVASGIGTPSDNTVTAAKTDISIVSGDIIYGDGTDSWTRLAKGTDGEVLKLASGIPSWGTAGTTTFVGLTDTPGSLTAGKHLKVNGAGNALELTDAPSGTITALNNATVNELVTVGATTTELDAEAGLTFQDTVATGLISGRQITGRGFECPATITDDWTIAAGNNAMFPGPMTVDTGKTVTVPTGRTLTVV